MCVGAESPMHARKSTNTIASTAHVARKMATATSVSHNLNFLRAILFIKHLSEHVIFGTHEGDVLLQCLDL